MLLAAPNEYLDFSHLNQKKRSHKTAFAAKERELDCQGKKKFKEGMQKIREKNIVRQSAGRRKTQLVNPVPNPKYDDVYYDGLNGFTALPAPTT